MVRDGGGVRALIGSAHAGPAVVVTLITLGLALAAGATPGRAALLTLGMLLGQLSVGWSNDWLDRGADAAAGRTDKPAAVGAISAATLRTAALTALVPGLVLPFLAGRATGLLHVGFVASAWAYNLGLKRTAASVVPYVLSFGSLPALATLLRTPPQAPALWATAAGVALGVAAHFANVVPDVDADRAAGSRGLPQRLGARASVVVAAVVVLLAAVAVLVGAHLHRVGGILVVVSAATAVGGLVTGLRRHPDRTPFRAVMSASLLLVVALLTVGSTL
jgi:4-hydroxybenzoate polyprenyltransferase